VKCPTSLELAIAIRKAGFVDDTGVMSTVAVGTSISDNGVGETEAGETGVNSRVMASLRFQDVGIQL
jgi:hypothetical protein